MHTSSPLLLISRPRVYGATPQDLIEDALHQCLPRRAAGPSRVAGRVTSPTRTVSYAFKPMSVLLPSRTVTCQILAPCRPQTSVSRLAAQMPARKLSSPSDFSVKCRIGSSVQDPNFAFLLLQQADRGTRQVHSGWNRIAVLAEWHEESCLHAKPKRTQRGSSQTSRQPRCCTGCWSQAGHVRRQEGRIRVSCRWPARGYQLGQHIRRQARRSTCCQEGIWAGKKASESRCWLMLGPQTYWCP